MLGVGFMAEISHKHLPEVVPETSPLHEFSAERARKHAEYLVNKIGQRKYFFVKQKTHVSQDGLEVNKMKFML